MAQIFVKKIGLIADLGPGEYRKISHISAAVVRCSSCREPHRITEAYAIAADGAVTPAWKCPTCSFCDWIILESWNE